ncbi:MAG TPA: acetone carboxylase subunit gamma, partial [Solirubrobacterales bacterium]|nr:acetone carboxylase subunit gamma [Solirubrobacterales bacterium]
PQTPGVAIGVREDHWCCEYCEGELGDSAEDWREQAVSVETSISERLAEADMYVRQRQGAPPVLLAEHFCPHCAGLLLADVYPEGFEGLRVPQLKKSGAALGV